MQLTSDDRTGARTRTFSWADPATLAAAGQELAGIDLLAKVRDGALPPPPIADLVDATIVSVEEGSVTFAIEPAEWMYNPQGSVHGGIAATVLDSCMGCAVHSLLPAGVGYTTTDLQIRYVRAMTEATGRALATAHVVHAGRRLMTVEAQMISEADGKLIAHGSSACVVFR
jgi:uncharacterized protein (TIGR00369 family)